MAFHRAIIRRWWCFRFRYRCWWSWWWSPTSCRGLRLAIFIDRDARPPPNVACPNVFFASSLSWMCAKYFTLIFFVSQKCNKCPCYLHGGQILRELSGNTFCLWGVGLFRLLNFSGDSSRVFILFLPFHFTPLDVALICGDSLCLAPRSLTYISYFARSFDGDDSVHVYSGHFLWGPHFCFDHKAPKIKPFSKGFIAVTLRSIYVVSSVLPRVLPFSQTCVQQTVCLVTFAQ